MGRRDQGWQGPKGEAMRPEPIAIAICLVLVAAESAAWRAVAL